jgi:hypothetical protein
MTAMFRIFIATGLWQAVIQGFVLGIRQTLLVSVRFANDVVEIIDNKVDNHKLLAVM